MPDAVEYDGVENGFQANPVRFVAFYPLETLFHDCVDFSLGRAFAQWTQALAPYRARLFGDG